jgi:CBS domain-containing protein
LLAVTPIPKNRLRPAGGGAGPAVDLTATLQEALATMLREGSTEVLVCDDGAVAGKLTADDIVAALAADRPVAAEQKG